jgi:hypothetical protein
MYCGPAFYPPRESARDKTAGAGRIFCHVECVYRRIAISDASTQDVANETSLAFLPMMR